MNQAVSPLCDRLQSIRFVLPFIFLLQMMVFALMPVQPGLHHNVVHATATGVMTGLGLAIGNVIWRSVSVRDRPWLLGLGVTIDMVVGGWFGYVAPDHGSAVTATLGVLVGVTFDYLCGRVVAFSIVYNDVP